MVGLIFGSIVTFWRSWLGGICLTMLEATSRGLVFCPGARSCHGGVEVSCGGVEVSFGGLVGLIGEYSQMMMMMMTMIMMMMMTMMMTMIGYDGR